MLFYRYNYLSDIVRTHQNDLSKSPMFQAEKRKFRDCNSIFYLSSALILDIAIPTRLREPGLNLSLSMVELRTRL
jgi:hypothetical protein